MDSGTVPREEAIRSRPPSQDTTTVPDHTEATPPSNAPPPSSLSELFPQPFSPSGHTTLVASANCQRMGQSSRVFPQAEEMVEHDSGAHRNHRQHSNTDSTNRTKQPGSHPRDLQSQHPNRLYTDDRQLLQQPQQPWPQNHRQAPHDQRRSQLEYQSEQRRGSEGAYIVDTRAPLPSYRGGDDAQAHHRSAVTPRLHAPGHAAHEHNMDWSPDRLGGARAQPLYESRSEREIVHSESGYLRSQSHELAHRPHHPPYHPHPRADGDEDRATFPHQTRGQSLPHSLPVSSHGYDHRPSLSPHHPVDLRYSPWPEHPYPSTASHAMAETFADGQHPLSPTLRVARDRSLELEPGQSARHHPYRPSNARIDNKHVSEHSSPHPKKYLLQDHLPSKQHRRLHQEPDKQFQSKDHSSFHEDLELGKQQRTQSSIINDARPQGLGYSTPPIQSTCAIQSGLALQEHYSDGYQHSAPPPLRRNQSWSSSELVLDRGSTQTRSAATTNASSTLAMNIRTGRQPSAPAVEDRAVGASQQGHEQSRRVDWGPSQQLDSTLEASQGHPQRSEPVTATPGILPSALSLHDNLSRRHSSGALARARGGGDGRREGHWRQSLQRQPAYEEGERGRDQLRGSQLSDNSVQTVRSHLPVPQYDRTLSRAQDMQADTLYPLPLNAKRGPESGVLDDFGLKSAAKRSATATKQLEPPDASVDGNLPNAAAESPPGIPGLGRARNTVWPQPTPKAPFASSPVNHLPSSTSSPSSSLSLVGHKGTAFAHTFSGSGLSSTSSAIAPPIHEPLSGSGPVLHLGQEGYYRQEDLTNLYEKWRTDHMKVSQQQLPKERNEMEVQKRVKDSGDGFEGGGSCSSKTVDKGKGRWQTDGVVEKDRSRDAEFKRKEEKAGRLPLVDERMDDGGVGSRRSGKQQMDCSQPMVDSEQGHYEDDADDLDEVDSEYDPEDNEEEDMDNRGEVDLGGPDSEGRMKRKEVADNASQSDSNSHRNSGFTSADVNLSRSMAAANNPRRIRARENKNHKCNECGKKFSRPSQLQTHQFTHSGEKPHRCHMCQKPFNVASNLKRHVRTHTNTKRKSSKNGSMVFRSFSHGALHKQSHGSGGPSGSGPEPTHAKSPSASSSSSSNTAASTTTSRRQLSLQQSDQLRWMNTETLVSGTMAASHQRAALKEKAGQGSNTPAVMRTLSSRSKTLTRPSMPSTPSVGSKSSSKALATATNATTPGARTILTSATITTMTDNIGSTRPPSLPAQTPPPTFSRAPSSSSDMLETKESQEPEESQEEYDGEKKKKAKKSYKGR